jgi:hypothetical protein
MSKVSYVYEIIAAIVYCLSVISFFIILIQWWVTSVTPNCVLIRKLRSIYCKTIFSTISIACFRMAVTVCFLLLLTMFIMNLLTICCGSKLKRELESSIFGAYIVSFFPLISFVIFAGFGKLFNYTTRLNLYNTNYYYCIAIWFGWCAFQMRNYHELRIQLI